MTIEEAFGQVIQELRKANSLSQEALADLSHIDRSFISLVENGRKQPSLITIFQLAKALNVSTAKIMAAAEEKLQSAVQSPRSSSRIKK